MPGVRELAPAKWRRRLAAGKTPFFSIKLPPFLLKFIRGEQAINRKAVDGFYTGDCLMLFEPPSGAPSILIRFQDQAVMHRIRMDVMQPGEMGFLRGDLAISKIMPDLSPGRGIKAIDLSCAQ